VCHQTASLAARHLAGNTGGAISNFTGTVTVTSSLVNGNIAQGFGGGIANFGFNTVSLTNVTLSGNRGRLGGGIANLQIGTLHLQNVTITNNTGRFSEDATRGSAGGVYNDANAALTVRNTLIAGNTAPELGPDCLTSSNADLGSEGYNLIANTSNCVIAGDTTGDILGQDPKLGELADNGGPTQTHALLAGSPAVDAGNPATPGSGGNACAAVDQRGTPRPQGERCDIGAFEMSAQSLPPLVLPDHGGNSGSVVAIVYGVSAPEGTTVKLSRTGQPDIPGDPVAIAGSSIIGTSFDLTGKAIGAWDVVVTKPDHTSATISQGFTVEATQLPSLWVEVIGRTVVRVGRPALFTVLYGNRGNVDAVAVPFGLTIPANVTVTLSFPVMPPPPQAGQVPTDWSAIPVAPVIDGVTLVPLLLTVVPAGFTGSLEIRLTPQPLTLGTTLTVEAVIGAGTGVSLLDADGVLRLVGDARAYAHDRLGIDVPSSQLAALMQYVTTGLQSAVAHGRATTVADAGTDTPVYSVPQLVVDAAKFGVSLAAASAPRDPAPASLLRVVRFIFRLVAAAMRTGAGFLQPRVAEAASLQSCLEQGLAYDSSTGQCLHCTGGFCSKGRFPFQPRAAQDPNDKVGPVGVGTGRLVRPGNPLSYSVFFENEEAASLPAQDVIVTDQLDGTKVDLDTFSIGPISFGSVVVVPPPGLSQFDTSVDLRPSKDLLVAIHAELEKTTGLASWRFSSLDPATQQVPDDPTVGFLPPNNVNSDGEGSVLFTVKPKTGLATGTQIANQASIVFDVNAPIATPQWVNTIDGSHDLAITKIGAPTSIQLTTAPVTKRVNVTIQNRGVGVEVIPTLVALTALVTLTVESLGDCPSPLPVLRSPTHFPATLPSRRSLTVGFDVTFTCANDPARTTSRSPGHGDYRVSARLDVSALGHADAHPDDDGCPRIVPRPGVVDPNPDGKIVDKGCGKRRSDGTSGDPVLIDVTRKP
jgi:hypothetical protein